jgi:hypothetical protein
VDPSGVLTPGTRHRTILNVNDRKELNMARLSEAQRHRVSSRLFAIPETRRYRIHDVSHARDALAMVSKNGTREDIARVRAAVKRRFPGITIAPRRLTAVVSRRLDSRVERARP